MSKTTDKIFHRFKTEEITVDPGQPRFLSSKGTRTFLSTLGTGTPSPNPYRNGPAGVVIAEDTPYLIDAGEGILRSIAKAATSHDKYLVDSFAPSKLSRLFLTHLHSDHVVGLPSIILNPWIFGRTEPMRIFGPKGTKQMVDDLLSAYSRDIRERIEGPERANDTGWRVEVTEIEGDGFVYEDENIKVEAFAHEHGTMENYGYCFTTRERKIVWAGDGKVSRAFLEFSRGVDFLVSEICSKDALPNAPWGGLSEEEKERIIWSYHIKPEELARLAEEAGVGTLILIHESNYSKPYRHEALLEEMKKHYHGTVYSSRDADVF